MRFLRTLPLATYALSLLAIASFCLARGHIAFLLIAGALAALSWYITEGPRGLALPKTAANLLILAASAGMVPDLLAHRDDVIGVIGRFCIWLLLFKLYERKDRRDYAQLLWLTALLMIAGALEARSLLFGISLAAYCAVGFYVLLLYQLFAANESSRDERQRQAPRYARFVPPLRPVLGRSVRGQFTALVAALGVLGFVVSTAIFLFAPRNVGAGFVKQLTQLSHQSRTGFVDRVDLLGGVGNRISDSRAPVLRVTVTNAAGTPIQVGEGLYLRGAALDQYDVEDHTWKPSPSRSGRLMVRDLPGDLETFTALAEYRTNSERDEARRTAWEIEVAPVTHLGVTAFTMLYPLEIASDLEQRVRYNQRTQDVQLLDSGGRLARYRVLVDPQPDDGTLRALTGTLTTGALIRHRYDNPRVRQLAEEILHRAALETLPPVGFPQKGQHNRLAAQAIAAHFQSGFTFTLDLSDVAIEGDPIEAFLFGFRRGHCEFYASAMTAMLQSVGVDARLVSGFLCSEYIGEGRYMVRESHAHAWVEVRTGVYQWSTFDPTPPAALAPFRDVPDSLAARMQGLWEEMEVGWMQNVVGYDEATQQDVQTSLHMESIAWVDDVVLGVDDWIAGVFDRFGWLGVIQIFVVSAALVIATIIVVRIVKRGRRIRRQLQLGHLHGSEYRRMVHQLGFYIDMLDILRRSGLRKPDWQPPLAFAASLEATKPEVTPLVRSLAGLFYHARYGGRELSQQDRDEASRSVQALAERLGVRV